MTIQFNCPKCNSLIAFQDTHAGKHAHCTTCNQHFIIPSEKHQKPQKLKSETQKLEPIPGFYKAVFIDSWKIFTNPKNATGLVFIIAAVCFKFFVAHVDYSFTMGAFRVQLPIGFIVVLVAWGCLLWYYMEIIHSVAFDTEQLPAVAYDVDELPSVQWEGFSGFVWTISKSVYIFFITLVIVQLPCIITIMVSKKTGTELPLLKNTFMLLGLFIFPMAILTVSVGKTFIMLRPDYLLLPIFRALLPYILVVGLFMLSWQLQWWTRIYGQLPDKGKLTIGLHLLANLGTQAVIITAMRSIGLFYRHYRFRFPW